MKNNIPIYEKWKNAFEELIKSRGVLSKDDELKPIQERIVTFITFNEEFKWETVSYLQKAIFLNTQQPTVDIPVILDVLRDLQIII